MKEKLTKLRTRLRAYQIYGRHLQPLCTEEAEPCTCLCCGTEYRGRYCPGCGQSSRTRRFTLRGTLENVTTIFAHADGRLKHTLTDLFTRPGYMIWDYLKGRRMEYLHPIQMLLFLGTLYLVLSLLLGIDIQEDAMLAISATEQEAPDVAALTKSFMEFLQHMMSNKAVAALVTILFIVWPLKVAFGKSGRAPQLNVAELFYAMCYMECLSLICSIFFLPLAKLLGKDTVSFLFPLDFFLQVWSFHQLFLISWRKSAWRLLCTLALVMLIVFALIIIAGAVVGYILYAQEGKN